MAPSLVAPLNECDNDGETPLEFTITQMNEYMMYNTVSRRSSFDIARDAEEDNNERRTDGENSHRVLLEAFKYAVDDLLNNVEAEKAKIKKFQEETWQEIINLQGKLHMYDTCTPVSIQTSTVGSSSTISSQSTSQPGTLYANHTVQGSIIQSTQMEPKNLFPMQESRQLSSYISFSTTPSLPMIAIFIGIIICLIGIVLFSKLNIDKSHEEYIKSRNELEERIREKDVELDEVKRIFQMQEKKTAEYRQKVEHCKRKEDEVSIKYQLQSAKLREHQKELGMCKLQLENIMKEEESKKENLNEVNDIPTTPQTIKEASRHQHEASPTISPSKTSSMPEKIYVSFEDED